MAKLPSSFRKKNRTTKTFRDQYAQLPHHIQSLTRDGCRLFDKDPSHKSFRAHTLGDRKQGSHREGSVSISITMQYRAIYVLTDKVNVWYWIGTHAAYKRFTASRR